MGVPKLEETGGMGELGAVSVKSREGDVCKISSIDNQ